VRAPELRRGEFQAFDLGSDFQRSLPQGGLRCLVLGGAPQQALGLCGGRQGELARRRQVGLPGAQAAFGLVQLAFGLGDSAFFTLPCGAKVAEPERRLECGPQARGDCQRRQGRQVGLDRLDFACLLVRRVGGRGQGQFEGGVPARQRGQRRAHRCRRQSAGEVILVTGRPAQLPHAGLDILPMHLHFLLPLVDVARVEARLLPALGERRDVGCAGQHGVVKDDRGEQRLQLPGMFHEELLPRRRRGHLAFGGGETGAGVRGKLNHLAEGSQFLLAALMGTHRGRYPTHPFESGAFGLEGPYLILQVGHAGLQCLHLAAGVEPVACAHRRSLQFRFSDRQFIFGRVIGAVTGVAARPELVGLRFELVADGAETADAGR